MKKWNLIGGKAFMAVVAAGCCIGLQSCLDDENNYYYYVNYPNALVTAKNNDDTFYLQLDDSTRLLPVNMASSPYGDKEVRALVSCKEVDEPKGEFEKAVHVYWMDSILTKPIALDRGDENDEVYGTDPVEIIPDWVTIAEDGYLTLRFRAPWGDVAKRHYVNLLVTGDAGNPYQVEFRHNAYGDVHGEMRDGLVAFRLDNLPDTEGKKVELTLKWKSQTGEKTAVFDYCSRKATAAGDTNAMSVRTEVPIG